MAKTKHHVLRQEDLSERDQCKAGPVLPFYLRVSRWGYVAFLIALALVGFAGLLALLKTFSGQDERSWPHKHFTRNTAVAAISTLIRSSLVGAVAICLSQSRWQWFRSKNGRERKRGRSIADLQSFDDASRGPAGSMKLLHTTHIRSFASLGALVMILAVGFQTFAQNILDLEYVSQLADRAGQDQAAPISRSDLYDTTFTRESHLRTWLTSMDMTAGIISGTTGQLFPEPLESCTSGNCSWPITPSLAMCGGCTDVTNLTTKAPALAKDTAIYTLPDGTTFHTIDDAAPDISNMGSGLTALLNVSASDGYIYNHRQISENQLPGRIYAANFNVAHAKLPVQFLGEAGNLTALSMHECALWFCVKAYNISYASGKRNVEVVGEWDQASPYLYNSSIHETLYFEDPGSMRNFSDLPAEFNAQKHTTFGVTYANSRAINTTAVDHLAGYAFYNWHNTAVGYLPDEVFAVWQARDNLTAYIENLAQSITNVIRSGGTVLDTTDELKSAARSKYGGTVTTTEPYVRVRWVWIIYPAVMLIAGVVYCVLVAVQSIREDVVPWQTSVIAPLLMSIVEPKDQLPTPDHETEAEEQVDLPKIPTDPAQAVREDQTECFLEASGRIPQELLKREVTLSVDERGRWTFS